LETKVVSPVRIGQAAGVPERAVQAAIPGQASIVVSIR